jgi:hypothetical protein
VAVLLAAPPARAQTAGGSPWSVSASLFTYVIPGEEDYAQPTVALDRKWAHIEARYDYEERDTGSLWFGYNFQGGDAVEWTMTPMLGGAFGAVTGVAPGYSASLQWRMLDVYSEGEYLSDLSEPANSFLYNWSEISVRPREWWRAGLVTQRTRARDHARDIQRGPLLGFTFRKLEVTAYGLAGGGASTVVLSAGWTFGED